MLQNTHNSWANSFVSYLTIRKDERARSWIARWQPNNFSHAVLATYRGAQQHHFGIPGCGTGAGGLDAPFWHPIKQQEEEAPCTHYPKAHKGQPPTTQTVALQLLNDWRTLRIMMRWSINPLALKSNYKEAYHLLLLSLVDYFQVPLLHVTEQFAKPLP